MRKSAAKAVLSWIWANSAALNLLLLPVTERALDGTPSLGVIQARRAKPRSHADTKARTLQTDPLRGNRSIAVVR